MGLYWPTVRSRFPAYEIRTEPHRPNEECQERIAGEMLAPGENVNSGGEGTSSGPSEQATDLQPERFAGRSLGEGLWQFQFTTPHGVYLG